MNSSQNKLFAWQDTTGGLIVVVLLDVLITYAFASLAIDTGSLLDYFITIVFLALTIGQTVKLYKKVVRRG